MHYHKQHKSNVRSYQIVLIGIFTGDNKMLELQDSNLQN